MAIVRQPIAKGAVKKDNSLESYPRKGAALLIFWCGNIPAVTQYCFLHWKLGLGVTSCTPSVLPAEAFGYTCLTPFCSRYIKIS